MAEQYLLCIEELGSLTWERCVLNDVSYPGASGEESFGKVKWDKKPQEPPAKGQGCGAMGITASTVPRGKARVVARAQESGWVQSVP